jgi:uncharacterized protein (DUF58 family)
MNLPRIWPGRALALLLLPPGLLSLAVFASPAVKPVILALDLAAVAVALLDLVTLRGAAELRVRRECGLVCSLGEPHPLTLALENRSRRPLRVWLRDDVPAEFDAEPAEFRLDIPAHSRAELEYRVIPGRRGTYVLAQADALVSSRLGLWRRAVTLPAGTTLRVYPDVRQITRYTLLARRDRLSVLGLRASRRPGSDNEFERLRDYAEGDDPRHLDWRATARRRKLTVRAHQQNQSQRILFLIDCGRMMTGDTGDGLSPLDHALNAMLLLAHVALIRHDQVGLLAFSDRTLAYVPPGGGARRIGRLVHAVHDVFPEAVETRYDRAFLELERRCRKRSLVVLLSNLFDEVNAGIVGQYLGNLSGRHLPLGVFLRDADLFALADSAPERGTGLYQAAAAADLLNWREEVLAGLRGRGVLTLDVFPRELTGELVSRYLEIKARHLL